MDGNMRKGDKPLPDNLDEILNEEQKYKLRQLEGFGWRLEFVRRPLFQEPISVVCNAEDSKIGTLEKDGSVIMEPDIKLRAQALSSLRQAKAIDVK